MRVAIPPDTTRIVKCFLADGSVVEGFYWRPEDLWYAVNGSKARKNALEVVDWRETGSDPHLDINAALIDDKPLSLLSPRDLTDRLNRIAELCRKHNNPASNVGAHALAGKVLKIVEGT